MTNISSQEPEANQTAITTGGGTYMAGNVTAGGDFVGRDQITINVSTPDEAAALLRQLGQQNELSQATIARQPFEPETILIPAGPAWLGSDDGPDHERPRHQVTLPAYRMGKYPVTNAEYAEFLRHNPKQTEPQKAGWFLRKPAKGQEQHPVVSVSWHDALAYCAWLSQIAKRNYQLPSEAEWEKAAGGPDGRRYPWGDDWRDGCANLNSRTTTPVDHFPAGASPYGCFDLLGNVQEWTSTAWQESDAASGYVLRGGSFRSQAHEVRCSARDGIHPDSKVNWRGFRVVLTC